MKNTPDKIQDVTAPSKAYKELMNQCELPPSGYIALDPEKYPAINNRGNLTTKQLALLAAAEEAYSGAASVLQPASVDVMDLIDIPYENGIGDPMVERFRTGLHLLEEAMQRHNSYIESLQ